MAKKKEDAYSCSFCGKERAQVRKLIAGPKVYICNECVDLCYSILEENDIVKEIILRANSDDDKLVIFGLKTNVC